MELKARIISIFLLFLLLLTPPCLSKGGVDVSNTDSGVYDIDYRGPETHSARPPPNRSVHKSSVHREGTIKHRKSRGLSGKKIHA